MSSKHRNAEKRAQANIQFERYAAIYIPGGTLALKGAIDAQAGKEPHCAPGCIFCEIDGIHLFDHWMRQGIR